MYDALLVRIAGLMAAALCFALPIPLLAEPPAAAGDSSRRLVAEVYDSGFPESHDTYNGITTGSDGRIYYMLSSQSLDVGAKMFVFDPVARRTRLLGDLTAACGESHSKAVPQGKSHVGFVESAGKLYFASHVGYYTLVGSRERMPEPPPAGYKSYPGGHVLSYDMASGRFTDFGAVSAHEGLITFALDCRRMRCYVLTWPSGRFLRFDLSRREWKDFGPAITPGEEGEKTCHTICRAIVVSPEDGSAWFTISTGAILRYRYDRDAVEKVAGEDLCKDYFGQFDPHAFGSMGYNWRQAFWHPAEHCIYGVHGNSGYLFRFDPQATRVDVLERLTSLPSRRSGMYDQYMYGYLGFALGPDQRTVYYLTGGPVSVAARRAAGSKLAVAGDPASVEDLHLVTYDLATGRYCDNGAVFLPDGQRAAAVNSLAVGRDGTAYALATIVQNGKSRTDLIRIVLPGREPSPQQSGKSAGRL